MPHQVYLNEATLGRDDDGRWTVTDLTALQARQNGKTDWLTARILTETRYLHGRTLYTSASLDAAVDLWRRVDAWVDGCPTLRRKVVDVKRSNGRERLVFRGGGVLQIKTTGGRAPRGFDAVSLLIYDEAREMVTTATTAALNPTQAAARNPQRLYTSNAGDLRSVVLNARRDAGRDAAAAGVPTRVGWHEWSAPPGCAVDDLDAIAAANPALGRTIGLDYLLGELPPNMPENDYRVEHLCQWVGAPDAVLDPAGWQRLELPASVRPPIGACALAFDVDLDRAAAAVAAAWLDPARGLIVAVLQHAAGAAWLPAAVTELVDRLDPRMVVADTLGPAVDAIDVLRRADLDVTGMRTDDVTTAAAAFTRRFDEQTVWHPPAPPLDAAVAIAGRRRIGDRWVFARSTTAGSVAPLTAAVFAGWAADRLPGPELAPHVVG